MARTRAVDFEEKQRGILTSAAAVFAEMGMEKASMSMIASHSNVSKALLFFLALLPQFIDTQRAVAPQMLILAATSMLPECCILLAYGWLAHGAAHASARFGVTRSMNQWLAWVEGVGLLGCATLVLKFSRSD